jgi:hypothetical protein
MLRGPKIQYSNDKVTSPRSFDLDEVLAEYVRLPEDARREFLAIFSHSLTVDMRVALLDRPVAEPEADRAWQINEWLHQLTSCFGPRPTRDAVGEAELIRDIAVGSFQCGLDGAVGRAVATAAGNIIAPAKKRAAAVD